jgi:hypothetical protein
MDKVPQGRKGNEPKVKDKDLTSEAFLKLEGYLIERTK